MAPFRDLTFYFLFLLLSATLGPLLFGYHLAELNAPSAVITCEKKAIRPGALSRWKTVFNDHVPTPASTAAASDALPQCIPMDPTQFGLVSSFFTLGGLLGALLAGPIISKQGRVRTMIYMAIFATVGPVFEALAPNVGTLTVGRFIAGLGAGGSMVVVPIYISDIAPPGRKGVFGSFTQVMVNMGILIAQVLGYFLSRGQMWRVILGVGGAIGLLQTVAFGIGGQESPKWMADNGKPGRAMRILKKIRGHDANIDDEVAGWGENARDQEDEEETLLANEDRMHEHPADEEHPGQSKAHKAGHAMKKESIGVFQVLRHPETRPAVIAVATVMVAQQFTGINSIVMYGVSLLSDLLEANSALLNVAVSALNVIVTASAAPLVDKLGRKTCLLMSIAGMGTSSVLLAVGIMRSIPVLSAVAVLFFVTSFGLGLGPVPFILSSELVGAEAVGATQSWALAFNWLATFIVAQFFPILNNALGKGKVYFIFAAFALVFGLFVVFRVPETKGKRDPDEIWGRSKDRDRED